MLGQRVRDTGRRSTGAGAEARWPQGRRWGSWTDASAARGQAQAATRGWTRPDTHTHSGTGPREEGKGPRRGGRGAAGRAGHLPLWAPGPDLLSRPGSALKAGSGSYWPPPLRGPGRSRDSGGPTNGHHRPHLRDPPVPLAQRGGHRAERSRRRAPQAPGPQVPLASWPTSPERPSLTQQHVC